VRAVTAGRRLKPGFERLPLVRAQETVLAGSRMPYREWLMSPDAGDPVWRPMRLGQALERVNVPVLLQEGWQDRFVDQMIEQYEQLQRRGVDVGLTIGPWTHVEVVTKGLGIVMEETLDWLAEHLAGTGRRHRPSPVHIFVTGAQEWRYLPDWPPATDERVLYLQPNGGLGNTQPTPTAVPSTFIYDPANPTPAVGGRVINPARGGYRDNRELEKRDDVLTFTGPPLNEPLEVIGNPVVELVHRTDNPHADLFVRLCEVRKNGRSINVSDAFHRLEPEKSSGIILLRLDAMAHRFTPGTRIRLQVSGGAHPRYARNLGTDEDPATSSNLAPSRRTIFHGDGGFSRIFLPCQLVNERDTVKS
jgi:putative CocE/NonD family hydrolase